MLQDHLDRDQLASLFSGGLPDCDERVVRAHLFDCPACEERIGEVLTSHQDVPQAFEGGDDGFGLSALGATEAGAHLRALESGLEAERQDAGRLFALLEAAGTPSLAELLQLDPGMPTWGFFERLLAEARRLLTTRPHRTRFLLKLAVGLAAHLDPLRYGAPQVETAKVRSWSHLGNIERVLGDFEAAEKAFRRAEFHYWQSDLDPLDEATLLELKAVLRRHQSRFDEALELMEGAISICGEVNERHRQGRAELGRAVIHLYSGKPELAAAGFGACLQRIDPAVEPQLPALCLINQILCLTEADQGEEAELLLPEARRQTEAVLLDESDHLRLRMRWIEARVDLSLGRLDPAESALRALQERFLADAMPVDAAFVTLDLAAVLVQAGRTVETRELVEEMIPVFQSLQIQREALAALIVLQQAAQTERLTLAMVREAAASMRMAAAGPGPQDKP